MNASTREIVSEDLIGLWVLLTAALGVALVVNQIRNDPLSLMYKPKEERLSEALEGLGLEAQTGGSIESKIDLDRFQALAKEKSAIILDARPSLFFQLGHVPGALSLPRDEFETSFALLRGVLEEDKSKTVIIYCSNSACEDAELVGNALKSLGFTNVSIFPGGWRAWQAAALPEEIK